VPRRAEIAHLPAEVQQWLDAALSENGFSQFDALSQQLKQRGFSISKSAVGRHSIKLADKLKRIKDLVATARTIESEAEDNQDALSGASIKLMQAEVMELMYCLQDDDDEGKTDNDQRIKLIGTLGKIIPELTRASTHQKVFAEKVRKTERERAADIAKTTMKQAGLSDERADWVRAKILGIAE
jgi:hypothetical protein